MDLAKQLELAERSRARQRRVAALDHAVNLAREGVIPSGSITVYAEEFVNFLEGPQRDD